MSSQDNQKQPAPRASGLPKESSEKNLKLAIDFAEWGWTIIANAHGGNWELESKDWQTAAAKYRDDFYNTIKHLASSPVVTDEVEEKG